MKRSFLCASFICLIIKEVFFEALSAKAEQQIKLNGIKIPPSYQNFPFILEEKKLLKSCQIFLNQEEKTILNGQTLNFYAGDVIVISSCTLNEEKSPIDSINLVGFYNKKLSPKEDDDQKVEIDTAFELGEKQRKWSVEKDDLIFATAVLVSDKIAGLFYLKRQDLSIKYMDVKINDNISVVRLDKPLVLKESDVFSVQKVVSNLENEKDIKVQIFPSDQKPNYLRPAKFYSMEFSYKNNVFTTFSIIVEKI